MIYDLCLLPFSVLSKSDTKYQNVKKREKSFDKISSTSLIPTEIGVPFDAQIELLTINTFTSKSDHYAVLVLGHF